MNTIDVEKGEQREKSAESRLVIAAAQLRMFADYPMGVGHRGTVALSRQYIPEEYLAKDAGVAEENRQRSSHNMFLSVLVEQGVIGVVIYFSLLVAAFHRVLKQRSAVTATDEQKRVSMLAAGVGGALVTVLLAGQFADYLRAEVLAWIYAMVVALSRIMTIERSLPAERQLPVDLVKSGDVRRFDNAVAGKSRL
jgi:O-antigen ligase